MHSKKTKNLSTFGYRPLISTPLVVGTPLAAKGLSAIATLDLMRHPLIINLSVCRINSARNLRPSLVDYRLD